MTSEVVFLDMDGTILNENNRVTEYTCDIINQVRQKGIKVFIATGRAFDEISYLIPDNFEVDGVIASNGAVGYVGDKEIFKHQLPMETVHKLLELAEEDHIYYELFPYYKNRIALKRDKAYLEAEIYGDEIGEITTHEMKSRIEALAEKIDWVDTVPNDAYSKFYFVNKKEAEIRKWQDKLEPMKEELNISISHSSTCNLETMPKGVNKATAIQEVLKYLNMMDDAVTYAVGDSDNDRQMLEYVDYPIVMKNAPDHIKALSKEVTAHTNSDNGVAEYLKDKFLNK